ncbi:MAG TPA: DPP IV N-terminal domain-containing protein, partial [Gemmatimonadaceae bacterium]|nr:DPP IV N-terminal domain-containing protein [Gemmatimonadaceae bacterium]
MERRRQVIYFTWLEAGSDWRLPSRSFRVRATPGSKPERVADAQMDSVAPMLDNGRMSPDGKWKVVNSGGDLYVVDVNTATVRRLTQTLEIESNPTFSADGREVFFVRDNNVYSVALDGGLI